jgi:hypothetical protein
MCKYSYTYKYLFKLYLYCLVGEEYSVADMACFPWYHQLRTGYPHSGGIKANEYLGMHKYTHANAWYGNIYMYINTYMHIYTFIDKYIYVYVYTCVYIFKYKYMFLYICIRIFL